MAKAIVGVVIDSVETWHAAGVAAVDYVTLCGLDGNDPEVGQTGTVEAKRGQKIDCLQCKQIWLGVKLMKLQRSDFI